MYPMRNKHGLVSRGLHKLKEQLRKKQCVVVYKDGLFRLEEVDE